MSPKVSTDSGELLSQSMRRLVSASRASSPGVELGNVKNTRANWFPSSRGSGLSSGRTLTGTMVTRSTGVDRRSTWYRWSAPATALMRTSFRVAPASFPTCFRGCSGTAWVHTMRLRMPGVPANTLGGLSIVSRSRTTLVARAPWSTVCASRPGVASRSACDAPCRARLAPAVARLPTNDSEETSAAVSSTASVSPSVRDSSTRVRAMPSASAWWMRKKTTAPEP